MKIKKQKDIKYCGIFIIKSLHYFFYEKWINENEIKINANFGLKGINIKNLILLGEKYKLKLIPYEASLNNLIKTIENSGMNHYVLFKYKKNKFYIFDSIKEKYQLTYEEFLLIYKNFLISVEKINSNIEKRNIKNLFSFLSKNLYLIFISILFSIIFNFVSSLFLKIIIDKIIPGKLKIMLNIICLIFFLISFLKILNNFIKNYFIKILSNKIEYQLTFCFINKIQKTKLQNINKLTKNDILRRFNLISNISNFMGNFLFIIFNEIIMIVVSSIILIFISLNLFLISLSISTIMIFFSLLFFCFIKEKININLKTQMDLFNSYMDFVNQLKEFKNINYKNFFNNKLKNNYIKNKKSIFKIWKYNSYQNFIETLISACGSILITFIATCNIFDNKITVGIMIMFITIFNNFNLSLKEICNFCIQFQNQKNYINLISFVLSFEKKIIKKD